MAVQQMIAGRYRLGRLLGSGGMGAVYLAEDLRLRREVAIKICSTQTLPPAEAQDAADLFQAEALTLARLRHSGLTAVWDYFNQNQDWYLVMEYVPGVTLRELLRQHNGRLSHSQVVDYIGQLCGVLGYLHAQTPPIVFRDLKPANIMVTPDGVLKLIDFGIARLFSPGKHADTAQFGTPGYAPPEQYGGQTEPRSDIYSLGVVAHQMLTGHNPTASAFMLPPARTIDPTLSADLEDVLQRATALDPVNRFPTVADFCVALRRAVQPSMSAGMATVAAQSPQEPISRPLWTPSPRQVPHAPAQSAARGWIVILVLLSLFGTLGAAGWLLRDQLGGFGQLFQGGGQVEPAPFNIAGTLVYIAPGPSGRDEVWLREGQGAPEVLTTVPDGANAALPALSPNRQQIAYTLDRSNDQQLWLLDRTTGQARQLLPGYAIARAAVWSPDGKRLAVEVATADMKKSDRDIIALDFATGKTAVIVDSPNWEGGPAWSPDSKQVVFHAIYGECMLLYSVGAGGGVPKQITQPPQAGDCTTGQGDFWPDWSPDGTRIAFGRKFGGVQRISVLDLRTNEIKTWDTDPQVPGQIPETGRPRPATHPRWSPDGTQVLFEEGSGTQALLSQLNLQTGEIITVPQSERAHLADWQ